ncbi:MAG: NTP transferase domain-containing protein [Ignavibacteria bacterium]|nr:NTP transferase domain-containing protein [Ignavibacteria bacterium]
MTAQEEVYQKAEELSSEFNYKAKEVSIILAAGHGKRIKSHRSKMLHAIWGSTTVERVFNASNLGIPEVNSILVAGIKAADVMSVIGKRPQTLFAYQAEQKGTGHAVQVALEKIDEKKFDGNVFVFPGDMGLINKETVAMFRNAFISSKSDMMVLTGIFEGNSSENSYGRIIRVKEKDVDGMPIPNSSQREGNNSSLFGGSEGGFGNVIEIKEYKDILSLPDDKPYLLKYKGKTFAYTKQELIENREFNSGVYAFDYKKLVAQIKNLGSENAQNEIYITDLISLFNKSGYSVSAISPDDHNVVMGFNDKSVLKEMENIYRKKVYDKLKNIIEIDDHEDFFIDESVVENILEMDGNGTPLDIRIGKGAYIGKGVKLNYNLNLKKNVFVDGNVTFGKNVHVWENVHLSTFAHQKLVIGDGVEILWGDIIKGNIEIGENTKIESSVNMTGSDEFPVSIGKNVLIKGTSYIFGCTIEDDIYIEHSVLIRKKITRLVKRNGEVQRIRFFLPMPSGIDAIENL